MSRGQGIRILLACAFLSTCAPAIVGQCVDYPDRRRKEAEQLPQRRSSQDSDFCDPQLLQGPGIVYQTCHRCEETLPLAQIKEDRAYLEFLSESMANAGAHANELDLQKVCQWAGEVRKRVRRLEASLALPETESSSTTARPAGAPIPSSRIDLANALILLSRLTSESLGNPVLSGLLLDQVLSAKAVRDLAQIETLAGSIQDGCQLLSKTSR